MNLQLVIIIGISVVILLHQFLRDKYDRSVNIIIVLFMIIILTIYCLIIIHEHSSQILNHSDATVYYGNYLQNYSFKSSDTVIDFLLSQPGFTIINKVLRTFGILNLEMYIISIFLIMYVLVIGVGLLFVGTDKLDYFLLAFLLFPGSANLMVNVWKQGFAVILMLIAFGIYLKTAVKYKIGITILILIVAMLFHVSAVYALTVFLGYLIFKNKGNKIYWIITMIMLILSVFNINQRFFGSLGSIFNTNYDNYMDPPSYVVYNANSKYLFIFMMIIFSLIILCMKYYVRDSDVLEFDFYEKIYLSLSWLFFAFSYLAFSDRTAEYAWVLFLVMYISQHYTLTLSKKMINCLSTGLVVYIYILSYMMNSGSYFINN